MPFFRLSFHPLACPSGFFIEGVGKRMTALTKMIIIDDQGKPVSFYT